MTPGSIPLVPAPEPGTGPTFAAAAAGPCPGGGADPQRRCIASGEVHDRQHLIRFVIAPDGAVTPDVDERLPGRGIWLSADRDLLNRAKKKNLFAKAARAPVVVAEYLPERVEALLARRCVETLGLARRAGQAVFGFERTREWLRTGRTGLIVEAADAAPGSSSKLPTVGDSMAVVRSLTAEEIGIAAGRERAVHGVVAPGTLADRLIRDDRRLAGFRRGTADRSTATPTFARADMDTGSPKSCDG